MTRTSTVRMAVFLAIACALAQLGQAVLAATVVNPVSAFVIDVDDSFSGGISSGVVIGRWSDIALFWFSTAPGANAALPLAGLQATTASDSNACALLYATIAPGVPVADRVEDLRPMYANAMRTNPVFDPTDEIARAEFPVQFNGARLGIRVERVSRLTGRHEIVGNPGDGTQARAARFFDVFVDIDNQARQCCSVWVSWDWRELAACGV